MVWCVGPPPGWLVPGGVPATRVATVAPLRVWRARVIREGLGQRKRDPRLTEKHWEGTFSFLRGLTHGAPGTAPKTLKTNPGLAMRPGFPVELVPSWTVAGHYLQANANLQKALT